MVRNVTVQNILDRFFFALLKSVRGQVQIRLKKKNNVFVKTSLRAAWFKGSKFKSLTDGRICRRFFDFIRGNTHTSYNKRKSNET